MPIKTGIDYCHCPHPECNAKLSTDWSCYEIGERRNCKTGESKKLYRCPYCTYEFTVDDCMLNAILVGTSKKPPRKTNDYVIVDEHKNVIFRIGYNGIYEIEGNFYVQFPVKILTKKCKLFVIKNTLSDKEISNLLKDEGAPTYVSGKF